MSRGHGLDGPDTGVDEEDTVLRPALPPQEDHSSWAPPPGPGPELPESTLAPSEDFIASVPSPAPQAPAAGSDQDFIDSAPPPSGGGPDPASPPWGTYLHSSLTTAEPPGPPAPESPAPAVSSAPAAPPASAAPPAPAASPAVPSSGGSPVLTEREYRPADAAPIQRFDQRPRFQFPVDPEPVASPSSAAAAGSGSAAGAAGLPPGVDATAPRQRRLLVPAIALGCAVLLLLGIGTGVGLLWLDQPGTPAASEPPAASSEEDPADPAQWRPLEGGEQPEGTPEELLQVMATNPLTAATLSVPAGCSLPASEGKVPDEELQAYLEAGASCLATTWGQALQEQGVDFTAPEVVVHPSAEPPAASSCAPETFTGTAPRACIGDNTLYWPAEWDPGFSTTSAVESPQLYMWHLSYSYAVFPVAATSLHSYYGALLDGLEGDAAGSEEMRRRYALQQSCFGSAAAFQQPTGPRPTERVEEFVTSAEAQADPASPAEPSAESRAAWVNAGRDANGDLSQCITWEAPADQVD